MDDYLDIQVRSPEAISARILIQFALSQRLIIEDLARQDEIEEDEDPEDLYFDLQVFLDDVGVRAELTESDERLLDQHPGHLGDDDIEALSDAAASLAALVSASLPDSADRAVDLSESNVRSLSRQLVLPGDERAAEMREIAEIVHWRVVIETELRESTSEERDELVVQIEETAAEANGAGLIRMTPRGDLELGGKSLSELNDVELIVRQIEAEAELKAMNWLCGFGSTWDDVPLEL